MHARYAKFSAWLCQWWWLVIACDMIVESSDNVAAITHLRHGSRNVCVTWHDAHAVCLVITASAVLEVLYSDCNYCCSQLQARIMFVTEVRIVRPGAITTPAQEYNFEFVNAHGTHYCVMVDLTDVLFAHHLCMHAFYYMPLNGTSVCLIQHSRPRSIERLRKNCCKSASPRRILGCSMPVASVWEVAVAANFESIRHSCLVLYKMWIEFRLNYMYT